MVFEFGVLGISESTLRCMSKPRKVNQGLVKDWNQALRETEFLNDIHAIRMTVGEPYGHLKEYALIRFRSSFLLDDAGGCCQNGT